MTSHADTRVSILAPMKTPAYGWVIHPGPTSLRWAVLIIELSVIAVGVLAGRLVYKRSAPERQSSATKAQISAQQY
jgi:hypothetical protein